jgi:hypothetical protein
MERSFCLYPLSISSAETRHAAAETIKDIYNPNYVRYYVVGDIKVAKELRDLGLPVTYLDVRAKSPVEKNIEIGELMFRLGLAFQRARVVVSPLRGGLLQQAAAYGAITVGHLCMLSMTRSGLFEPLPAFGARTSADALEAIVPLDVGVPWDSWTLLKSTTPRTGDVVVERHPRDIPYGKAGVYMCRDAPDGADVLTLRADIRRVDDGRQFLKLFNELSGQEQEEIDRAPSSLRRRFIIAPSGSGKTVFAGSRENVVDADTIFHFPAIDRWWESPVRHEVNAGNAERLKAWLRGPHDGKVILYAKELPGVTPDGAVLIPADEHLRRLTGRDKSLGQPNEGDWDVISQQRTRFKLSQLREGVYDSFTEAVAGRPLLARWVPTAMSGFVRFSTYVTQMMTRADATVVQDALDDGPSSSSASETISDYSRRRDWGVDPSDPTFGSLIVYAPTGHDFPLATNSQNVYVKPFTAAIRSRLGLGSLSMAKLRVTAFLKSHVCPLTCRAGENGTHLLIDDRQVVPSGHTVNLIMQAGVAPIDVSRYWLHVERQGRGRTRRELSFARKKGGVVELGGIGLVPYHSWWEYYTAVVAAPNVAAYFGFTVPRNAMNASREFLVSNANNDVQMHVAVSIPVW